MSRGVWGCHRFVRATLCVRRARLIVPVRLLGTTPEDLPAGQLESLEISAMRRTYQAKIDAERRAGKTKRCYTTKPNAGHKPEWGPRISSAAGNRIKVTWKKRVLERMRAFSGTVTGTPEETKVHYLSVVMPEVWSELLAAGSSV